MDSREQVMEMTTKYLETVLSSASQQEIRECQDLRNFPEFDSLGVLETLVWLESTFDIVIPDEELVVDHFDSVEKMVDYVLARKS